jgi:hypothetical protein
MPLSGEIAIEDLGDDDYLLYAVQENAFIAADQPEDPEDPLVITTDMGSVGIFTRENALKVSSSHLGQFLPVRAEDIFAIGPDNDVLEMTVDETEVLPPII